MIPVSDAFLDAVRGSHSMAARARVCTTFQTGTDPDGTELTILDGDVRLDATADIRGTLDLTTDGNNMWPSTDNTLLLPYGNEVFVERGIYLSGVVEWAPLGYYRIDGPDQDDAPNGPIRLTGSDRMAGIVDGRLTSPRAFPASMTYGAAVEDLVLDIYPTATIEWDDGTSTSGDFLGRNLAAEQDRYGMLRDLATSVGKIAYWDHRGVLVITDPPSVSTPVFSVDHGDGGVLVKLARELSRQGVYNGVVAEGESGTTDTPVRAVRIDNNPSSPTYWFGSFGKVPRFYASPFVTTTTQARSAADAILRKALGLPYSVDFTAVPNPALEPWDPVEVTYSDKPAELHIIESVTIPLTASAPMTAATREQTTIIIGEV